MGRLYSRCAISGFLRSDLYIVVNSDYSDLHIKVVNYATHMSLKMSLLAKIFSVYINIWTHSTGLLTCPPFCFGLVAYFFPVFLKSLFWNAGEIRGGLWLEYLPIFLYLI